MINLFACAGCFIFGFLVATFLIALLRSNGRDAEVDVIDFIKWSGAHYIRYNSIENGGVSIWISRFQDISLTDEQVYELYLKQNTHE